MVELTRDKREELANYAKGRLSSHVIHGGCSDEEDIFKIALAVLTAEKRATVDVIGVIWNEWKPEVGTPLFTAPPVPEIKLPQIVSRSEIAGNEVAREWFLRGCDWYEKEIKRLHGLGE